MSSQRAIGATVAAILLVSWPARASESEEVFIEATAPDGPPTTKAKVHGDARLGLGFGAMIEDPFATLHPAVALDLREVVPLSFSLGTPIRLRMVDRAPEQGGVVRGNDWDEGGDYVSLLERVTYGDEYVFGDSGLFAIDVRAGRLGRMQLGHGSVVRGYANSLDIDRRRTGLDAFTRVEGQLLGQPAGAEAALLMGDLAGSQILGTRIAGDWAYAGLGFSVVGDPLAPRTLARDAADPDAFLLARGNRLDSLGQRGVVALGIDLSYRATDRWRWMVLPYLDLNTMPGLGSGLHLGVDSEFTFGRRRRVRLGFVAELTVGSADYDPTYFDVFYLSQRWQVPFVASPVGSDRPATFGADALPKYRFVEQEDLGGVGGYGAVRFAHAAGAFAETGYHYRPGELGHTWETRVGVELEAVELAFVHAHRGQDHGFDVFEPAGSLARIDVRVPIIRYLDAVGHAGWLFAIRPDPAGVTMAADPSGLMTGAGFFDLGVAGRIPW